MMFTCICLVFYYNNIKLPYIIIYHISRVRLTLSEPFALKFNQINTIWNIADLPSPERINITIISRCLLQLWKFKFNHKIGYTLKLESTCVVEEIKKTLSSYSSFFILLHRNSATAYIVLRLFLLCNDFNLLLAIYAVHST